MALTKNLVNIGDATITGDLNINGKINGYGIHEHIPITLCKIENAASNEVYIYLGIPKNLEIDLSKYDLTYVRYSKCIKYKHNSTSRSDWDTHIKWHKIKYSRNTMNSCFPQWVSDYPNDIIIFKFVNTNIVDFSANGFNYYQLQAMYVNGNSSSTSYGFTEDIDSYVNMDFQANEEGLPYDFTDTKLRIPDVRYLTAGRLMCHNKCGLCLMKDGVMVSNVALLRTYLSQSSSNFRVAVKNA